MFPEHKRTKTAYEKGLEITRLTLNIERLERQLDVIMSIGDNDDDFIGSDVNDLAEVVRLKIEDAIYALEVYFISLAHE